MSDWHVFERDRELFRRELESFVPPRVFDAHAHWYATAQFSEAALSPLLRAGPSVVGRQVYDDLMAALLPGRDLRRGLFFPFPNAQLDVAAANEFLFHELQQAPEARGQMLITPQHDPEFIRQTVQQCGFVGLKCYHVYSPVRPTFESPIGDFLPEPQVRVAHEEGLSITLHIVRERALADRGNQEWIRRTCERYPNVRLILAHAARGFNPHHTIEGIESLRGLGNVWFDTSVVTDCGALEAILHTFGHRQLLYGSDFPVSHVRGRCVALGDSFFWISAENTKLDVPYAKLELSLVGLEALRTLKVAAQSLRLTDAQVEDVFHNNAAELYWMMV
jgi:glutamate-1-semialdehyde 2,1-aminomutase